VRAACPQILRVGPNRGVLADAGLFYGPPEKRLEQMGETAKGVWRLPALQRQILADHEWLYLLCRYKGSVATVTVQIPRAARKCAVRTDAKGITRAQCE
jgi:hypothetical protein